MKEAKSIEWAITELQTEICETQNAILAGQNRILRNQVIIDALEKREREGQKPLGFKSMIGPVLAELKPGEVFWYDSLLLKLVNRHPEIEPKRLKSSLYAYVFQAKFQGRIARTPGGFILSEAQS